MNFNSKLKNIFEDVAPEEEGTEVVSSDKGHLVAIDQEKANALLASECSDFEEQQQIFNLISKDDLEVSGDSDFYVYDPLKADRPFDGKFNVMFMDKTQPWDAFPKRRNAVVAYPSKDKITDDGITYVAIPFNKTKLGICPKDKLVDSFNNVAINLGMKFEYFNRSFNIVLNIFNNPQGTYEEGTKKLTLEDEISYGDDWGKASEAMKITDEQLLTDEGKQVVDAISRDPFNKETHANVISILEYLNAKSMGVTEMANVLFEPEANSFKFEAFKSFIVGDNKDKEVWFNNKCLLVKEHMYNKLTFNTEELDGVDDDVESLDQQETPVEEPTEDPI